MRIVSLLPSATEIIAGLGALACLVGRSHECDHPTGVLTRPICSRPKIRLDHTSAQIDRSIRFYVEQGLSVFAVDGETLRDLKPDVIVTQTQCEVCAVSESQIRSALEDWLDYSPAVVSVAPMCLADVFDDILTIGAVVGEASRAATLRGSLEKSFGELRKIPHEAKPKVACIEWIDPLMAAGNWVPELVEIAGGIDVLGEPGRHSQWLSWDTLRAADPDIVILMPCGFDLARTSLEARRLRTDTNWKALRAVRDGRAYLVDGHNYFNRPGPRLLASTEILLEIIHAEPASETSLGYAWQSM